MWSNQEIIFAQKATAIVKASGMDPRLIDLDHFRLMSPIIFTRAYCAIYKENEFTLDEDSGKEDVILVSQLVIDGLVAKTRNPALSLITGFDVYQRNHRAIGILVGILFDEGQRLWLEKRGSSKERSKSPHSSRHGGESANSPREIRKLLNKIDSLEGQIKKSKRSKEKSSNDHNLAERSENSAEDPETGDPNENNIIHSPPSPPSQHKRPHSAAGVSRDLSNSDVVSRLTRPSSAGTTRVVQQLRKQGLNSYTDLQTQMNANGSSLPIPPAQMPRSPTQQNKQQISSSSLNQPQFTYDLKSGRKIPLKSSDTSHNHQKIISGVDQLNFQQNKQIIQDSLNNNVNKNNSNDKQSNPYPTKAEYPSKKIEKQVQDWLKRKQELDRYEADPTYQSNLINPGSAPSSVVVYHPCYATMEESDLIISVEYCHDCKNHNMTLRHDPKEYFEKALKMAKQLANDIFNGDYCVRLGICVVPADLKAHLCQPADNTASRIGAFEVQISYKSPLTHDTDIDLLYSKLQTRRWPSKSVIEKRLNSFLAKNNIPIMKSGTNTDFESVGFGLGYSYPKGKCYWDVVSVASPAWSYSFSNGNNFLELLYDFRDLAPKDFNKKTMAKSTVQQAAGNKTTYQSPRINNNQSQSNTSSPAGSTKPTASFSSVSVTPRDKSQFTPNSYALPPAPLFAKGQKVWVNNVSYTKDCLEPSPLIGTVKQILSNNDDSENPHSYKIQLQYYFDEIESKECDLVSYESSPVPPLPLDYDAQMDPSAATATPKELKAFFHLLEKHSLFPLFWNFPSKGDQINIANNEIEYSRKTIFLLLRQIIWEAHQYFQTKNLLHEFYYNDQQETVNLHLVYAENILNFLFYSVENQSLNKKDYVNQSYLMKLPTTVLKERVPFLQLHEQHQSPSQEEKSSTTTAKPEIPTQTSSVSPVANRSPREPSGPVTTEQPKTPQTYGLQETPKPLSKTATPIQSPRVAEKGTISVEKTKNIESGEVLKENTASTSPRLQATNSKNEQLASTSEPLHKSVTTSPRENKPLSEQNTETTSNVLLEEAKSESNNSISKNTDNNSVNLEVITPADKDPAVILSSTEKLNNLGGSSTSITLAKSAFEKLPLNALSTDGDQATAPSVAQENNLSVITQPRPMMDIPKVFENKDILISSIILDGTVLSHENYDSLFVSFIYETHKKQANVCLIREKGSKRRSFNLQWEEIPITAIAFKESVTSVEKACVNIVLTIDNRELLAKFPTLPVMETTEFGKSLNCCRIPLLEFYKDTFEIKCDVILPNFNPVTLVAPVSPRASAGGASSPREKANIPPQNPGKVTITIIGHAREGKENRRSRIMSMKPAELLTMKFEPLPVDDFSDDEEDSEEEEKKKKQRKSSSKALGPPQPLSARKSTMKAAETIVETEEEADEEENYDGDVFAAASPEKHPPATSANEKQDESLYENSFEHEQDDELKTSLFPKASNYNLLSK
jgi:hypothetical protein